MEVTWIGIVASFVGVLVGLGTAGIAWMNFRIDKEKALFKIELAEKEAELLILRTANTTAATTVLSSISPGDALKVLYIGDTATDQLEMIRVFRVAGIRNQVEIVNNPQAGFDYLKKNLNTLFAIIYVLDIKKGTDFLDLVMNDDATKGITVFFIDGNDPAKALAAYEGGGAGLLKSPIDWTTLLGLLNKSGLKMTVEKKAG